eukprot:CAMPEP_0196808934 /NCGR_PEP_ID=MMETSP1362-20130617/8918_1 /TAXON_ID=163516 /ORGANISM="Leptocylindrus danicus, Strain CCMP1856" /LENGTH=243 /DNA_ID=CAMNT_0042183449 /DNA_START=85 /DNA_END=817 /DNA_ORIENTATION=-
MTTSSEHKDYVERRELQSMNDLDDTCIIGNHENDKEGKFADAHTTCTGTTPMTAATTEQMANCNDMTGNAIDVSPTTPRGIFKVPRTNQEGRLDVVNEHLDNLEAATIGGDPPPIATLIDDAEVLEYAEAVPVEDSTDIRVELEQIIRRNQCLKRVTAFLLIIIALSIGMVFFLDNDSDDGKEEEKRGREEQNEEECGDPFPILCDLSLGEATPDEANIALILFVNATKKTGKEVIHSIVIPK